MYAKSSPYYTGRINLRFTIQRRQLRAYHTDAHWCNTLFRDIRELAIQNRGNCVFISCDDKSKIDFDEPGTCYHLEYVERRVLLHQTPCLCLLTTMLEGNIIPTVDMICDVPESIDDSFYQVVVNIKLKEGVFQLSSTTHSTLELVQTMRENEFDNFDTPNVYMITDGGPEHRLTFESVKISLIMLFNELNIDFLVAIRTAPGA